MTTHRQGVSLVEVLVVIGTIGVLVGLALPAVNRVRGAAARTACQNNLKQIGIAIHHYHEVNGRIPPAPVGPTPGDPNYLLGWMALILPQMEQEPLYQQIVAACQADQETLNNPPHTGIEIVVLPYTCPADGRLRTPLTDTFGVRAAFTSYTGIDGVLQISASDESTIAPAAFAKRPGYRFGDITDGLSQTLLVSERPPPDSLQAGWWYHAAHSNGTGLRGPNNTITIGRVGLGAGDPCDSVYRKGTLGPGRLDNPCDRYHLWSLHDGGVNALYADASVRFLPYSAEPLLGALVTVKGGETVDVP